MHKIYIQIPALPLSNHSTLGSTCQPSKYKVEQTISTLLNCCKDYRRASMIALVTEPCGISAGSRHLDTRFHTILTNGQNLGSRCPLTLPYSPILQSLGELRNHRETSTITFKKCLAMSLQICVKNF